MRLRDWKLGGWEWRARGGGRCERYGGVGRWASQWVKGHVLVKPLIGSASDFNLIRMSTKLKLVHSRENIGQADKASHGSRRRHC
jgi:hypothetical protein